MDSKDFTQLLSTALEKTYHSSDQAGVLNVMNRLVQLGFFEAVTVTDFVPTTELSILDFSLDSLDFIRAIVEPVTADQETMYRLLLQVNKKVLMLSSKEVTPITIPGLGEK